MGKENERKNYIARRTPKRLDLDIMANLYGILQHGDEYLTPEESFMYGLLLAYSDPEFDQDAYSRGFLKGINWR